MTGPSGRPLLAAAALALLLACVPTAQADLCEVPEVATALKEGISQGFAEFAAFGVSQPDLENSIIELTCAVINYCTVPPLATASEVEQTFLDIISSLLPSGMSPDTVSGFSTISKDFMDSLGYSCQGIQGGGAPPAGGGDGGDGAPPAGGGDGGDGAPPVGPGELPPEIAQVNPPSPFQISSSLHGLLFIYGLNQVGPVPAILQIINLSRSAVSQLLTQSMSVVFPNPADRANAAAKIPEYSGRIMKVFLSLCKDNITASEAGDQFSALLAEVGTEISATPEQNALASTLAVLPTLCVYVNTSDKGDYVMCNETSAAPLTGACPFAASATFQTFLSSGKQDVKDIWPVLLDSTANMEALCANADCLSAMESSCLAGEVSMMLSTYCGCHQALPEGSCKTGLAQLAVSSVNMNEMIMFSGPSDSALLTTIQGAAASFCSADDTTTDCFNTVMATSACQNDAITDTVSDGNEALCCAAELFADDSCLAIAQAGDSLGAAFINATLDSQYSQAMAALEDPTVSFGEAVDLLAAVGINSYGDMLVVPTQTIYCDVLSSMGIDPAALAACGPKLACFDDEKGPDDHGGHRHLLDGHVGGEPQGPDDTEMGLGFLSSLCTEDSCVASVVSSCFSTPLADLEALLTGFGTGRRHLLDGQTGGGLGDLFGDNNQGGMEAILGLLGPLLTPLCSEECHMAMESCPEAMGVPGMADFGAVVPALQPLCDSDPVVNTYAKMETVLTFPDLAELTDLTDELLATLKANLEAAAGPDSEVLFGDITVGSVNVETVVLFPGADYDEAKAKAEALKNKITDTPAEVFTSSALADIEKGDIVVAELPKAEAAAVKKELAERVEEFKKAVDAAQESSAPSAARASAALLAGAFILALAEGMSRDGQTQLLGEVKGLPQEADSAVSQAWSGWVELTVALKP
eukprot:CAMPEP_0117652866 /NCGR_PEP_ID=MMETSP0804-20121206/2869_1 /TAXON_ID=1074897 /ORGANISM="Tetraselmis astigmatica, Strain CCMP880" /LENGTH=923 /DNA_ID=CAMNT_0005458969 /DNA_START=62 /DNA_END=2834 /DNA_ORIENTATION=-